MKTALLGDHAGRCRHWWWRAPLLPILDRLAGDQPAAGQDRQQIDGDELQGATAATAALLTPPLRKTWVLEPSYLLP